MAYIRAHTWIPKISPTFKSKYHFEIMHRLILSTERHHSVQGFCIFFCFVQQNCALAVRGLLISLSARLMIFNLWFLIYLLLPSLWWTEGMLGFFNSPFEMTASPLPHLAMRSVFVHKADCLAFGLSLPFQWTPSLASSPKRDVKTSLCAFDLKLLLCSLELTLPTAYSCHSNPGIRQGEL